MSVNTSIPSIAPFLSCFLREECEQRNGQKRGDNVPARSSQVRQKYSRGRKGLTSLSSVSLFSPYPSGGRNVEQGRGAQCFPLCPIHSTAHFSSNSARRKDEMECSRSRDDCKALFSRFLPAAGLACLLTVAAGRGGAPMGYPHGIHVLRTRPGPINPANRRLSPP